MSNLRHRFQGDIRVGIKNDQSDVWLSLQRDVREYLVLRTLRFKPDSINAQQQLFQCCPGCIVGVDNGKTDDTLHWIALEFCKRSRSGGQPE